MFWIQSEKLRGQIKREELSPTMVLAQIPTPIVPPYTNLVVGLELLKTNIGNSNQVDID
jgi:hypothetical protein